MRTPSRSKPRPTAPQQWWGIDMTKVMVQPLGCVYVVIVLDWYTKKIVGHYAGLQAKSTHWLLALEQAVQSQFPAGIQGQRLSLMSDNGCQPTSVAFMKTCVTLGIAQAFTSYNNPKGNADTERLMRTLKEELLWLREWTSPLELERVLAAWVDWYNTSYLHSALGYRTPGQVEQHYSHSTQFVAACQMGSITESPAFSKHRYHPCLTFLSLHRTFRKNEDRRRQVLTATERNAAHCSTVSALILAVHTFLLKRAEVFAELTRRIRWIGVVCHNHLHHGPSIENK